MESKSCGKFITVTKCNLLQEIVVSVVKIFLVPRGFIKGQTRDKLTACEHEFARLFLNLGFQHNCTC